MDVLLDVTWYGLPSKPRNAAPEKEVDRDKQRYTRDRKNRGTDLAPPSVRLSTSAPAATR